MNLAAGVNLHVVRETKFKTIRVMVRFREELKRENVAKRALISNLWERSNEVLPTGKEFSEKLAENYGATFATGISIKGSQHFLTATMNVVDPQLVGEKTLKTAINFLQQVIFRPLWDSRMFEVEKTNLLHYLEAMTEDNDAITELKLNELFYSDENQATPNVGTVDLTEKETMESVKEYYESQLLTKNAVDIFVLGDVKEPEILRLFGAWTWKDRKENLLKVFYQQPKRNFLALTESKEANQSILAMAWMLPIQYGEADYLTLQVMNGLFGALPHSKLFSIVRERESLAYEITSSFDSFTGFYRVMAGIDAENFEKTHHLVNELLDTIKSGDFTDDDIQQTKEMLHNGYMMGKDSPAALMEEKSTQVLVPERYLNKEKWLSALVKVTKVDIQRVASQLIPQVIYFLKGEF